MEVKVWKAAELVIDDFCVIGSRLHSRLLLTRQEGPANSFSKALDSSART